MKADLQTTCCIAGGGPAGIVAGLLLARAGVDVVVLEKHGDFLRDFRGDTVHPSTLEVMSELGLLEAFLERPHQKVYRLVAVIDGKPVTVGDFSRLRVTCPFVALMPQWDFLDLLAGEACRLDNFRLLMNAEVTDLLRDGPRVTGVRVTSAESSFDVRARLTIGADGRSSRVRACAGLEVEQLAAPIDVMWLRLPRRSGEDEAVMARVSAGHVFVMIARDTYWQCAHVIPKGNADLVRARGIDRYRQEIAAIAPELGDRVHELHDWDQVSLLTVKVDRLRRWWRPGLLMIGDAAHAMSPVGGVGINLAVQDAVAAANILSEALSRGQADDALLARVQRRRLWPTRITQRFQVIVQDQLLQGVLGARQSLKLPWPLRLLDRYPSLQRFPARMVGLGVRPEHVLGARRGGGRRASS